MGISVVLQKFVKAKPTAPASRECSSAQSENNQKICSRSARMRVVNSNSMHLMYTMTDKMSDVPIPGQTKPLECTITYHTGSLSQTHRLIMFLFFIPIAAASPLSR